MMQSEIGPSKWQLQPVTLPLLTCSVLLAYAATASAQSVTPSPIGQVQAAAFSTGKVFIFLFITLGPLKLLRPFVSMTQGMDDASRRRLAFSSTVFAVIGIILASTAGVAILSKWNISVGALLLTAGIILFLVALKPILEQYNPHEHRPDVEPTANPPSPSPMRLAFPTIVTPYGIAVLIVLVALRPEEVAFARILGVAIFVLLLDLVAMLYAKRILGNNFVAAAFGIVGAVMEVLQVALGVQAMVTALRLLGFKS
jgi:multiple antibiotic resistance protein